jgi:DNA-directed RNA polymerase specialized sigma24 family protein
MTSDRRSHATMLPRLVTMFRENYLWILAAVQRFGVPARQAQDVALHVFVALFKATEQGDAGRPLKLWLKSATYRAARDHLAVNPVERSG